MKYYFSYTIKIAFCLLASILLLSGCSPFEKEIDYVENNSPTTSMLFVVPDAALAAVPSGNQLQLSQPNANVIGATFPASGNADITLQFNNDNVSSVTVNIFRTVTVNRVINQQRELKATISNITNRQAKFTEPISSLGFAGEAPGNTIILEFIGTTTQGKTIARFFTITKGNG